MRQWLEERCSRMDRYPFKITVHFFIGENATIHHIDIKMNFLLWVLVFGRVVIGMKKSRDELFRNIDRLNWNIK